MKPEMIAVERLTPHPRNSRTHSSDQIVAIGRSIREFGFVQPVVTDEHLTILIGHGRVEAAKDIGMPEVPVVVRKGLTDAQKRALLIADNRLAELGSRWDQGVLDDELRALLGEGFDITLTGFDLPEWPEDKEAPEPKEKPAIVSVQGDLWALGPHRLVVGDGRYGGAVAAACGALKPGLVVTECATLDPEDEHDALVGALSEAKAPVAYLWCNPHNAAGPAEALQAAGFEIRNQIIRLEDKPRGGGRYPLQHSLAWYGVRKGSTANWLGGRTQSTVWETGGGATLSLDCWKRPIVNHLGSKGVVFDPFANFGTGLIAAHQTGRIFVGCEFDEALCDIIISRWQSFTSLEATHGKTGDTFSDTGEDRRAAA